MDGKELGREDERLLEAQTRENDALVLKRDSKPIVDLRLPFRPVLPSRPFSCVNTRSSTLARLWASLKLVALLLPMPTDLRCRFPETMTLNVACGDRNSAS
jgi:hypothetical protein